MLNLWNSRTRQKEEIRPIHEGRIGFYACGPTVYQRAQIGNFRTYLIEDFLRRALEHEGLRVNHVMNITDVGHLTDDASEGEDKMERQAKRTGESAYDIANKYTQLFFDDAKALNILRPTHAPKATEHIDSQIELIKLLEKKGYTYRTSDGIYFDTSKWENYGSLSGQSLSEKEEGARVEKNPEKRNASDFALWKFSPKEEKRQMEWASPWGIGFPGWHIECSAMSQEFLGQPFDIHAGGVDHLPVHHENEIAQSEAATGKRLANVWMHIEHLHVDGKRMGKSLGNAYTLDDLEAKDICPLSFRYFILGAHYRQKQNFTWDAVKAASITLNKLRNIIREWDEPKIGCAELEAEFFDAIEDDLNTPKALAVVWKLVDSDNPTASKAASLLKMDEVLGLGLADFVAEPLVVPAEIQRLVAAREDARAAKNWEMSDKIRLEIEAKGWKVEDTAEGPKVRATSSS